MNVGGLGNADFDKASVARKSPSSIRCVAITTRRRYEKSLLSHRHNFRTPSSQSDEFMLVARRLRARLKTAMQKGIRLQLFTAKCVWKIACSHQVRSGTRREEPTVTRNGVSAVENNEAIVKRSLRARRAHWNCRVTCQQILNLPNHSAEAPNTFRS